MDHVRAQGRRAARAVHPPCGGHGGRRRDLAVLAAGSVLAVALTGCGVEAVEGDIADQQLCVAAQRVVQEYASGGTPSRDAGGALRELAGEAVDPELRVALTEVSESYADETGANLGSPAWEGEDPSVGPLTRVCQRLSAF